MIEEPPRFKRVTRVEGWRGLGPGLRLEAGACLLLRDSPGLSARAAAAAALALACQREPFRLEVAHPEPLRSSFLAALADRDGGGILVSHRLELDPLPYLLKPAYLEGRPAAEPYRFELLLDYGSDSFDGGASGLLRGLSLRLLEGSESLELCGVERRGEELEFRLELEASLALPFVANRLPQEGEAEDRRAALGSPGRSAAILSDLAAGGRGAERARLEALARTCRAAEGAAALDKEFAHIVFPEPEGGRGAARRRRPRELARARAGEAPHLRAPLDVFVAGALAERGLDRLLSRRSGLPIRASFYALFYEILEAAGLDASGGAEGRGGGPLVFAEEEARDPGMVAGTVASLRSAEGRYGAALRDALAYEACRRPEGGFSLEGSRLGGPYARTIEAFRSARPGADLVPEGGPAEPLVLDLEARRAALSGLLRALGLGEELEILPGGSRRGGLSLAASGERLWLEDMPYGRRRLVLMAAALLHLPWGSLVLVEEPEAGLEPRLRRGFGLLARALVESAGASLLVRSEGAEVAAGLEEAFAARPGAFRALG